MTVKITNGLGSNVNVNNMPPPMTIKVGGDKPAALVDRSQATVIESHPNTVETKPSTVSFERNAQTIPGEGNVPLSQTEQLTESIPETPLEGETQSDADHRKERRDAFKRAADIEKRAMAMEKEAKNKLAQASNMQQLLSQAKDDPTVLAKALGMSTEDFLRAIQNKVLSIPTEVPVRPEDEVKQRLAQYDQERANERQYFQEMTARQAKQNFVMTNIVPAIKADPDRFQLLNNSNVEQSAAFLYDIMNEHYRATCVYDERGNIVKQGEQLDAAECAQAMEDHLMKELEDKIQSVKGIGKLSKYFRDVEEQIQDEQPPPSNLGGNARPTWNGAQSPVPTKGRPPLADKKSRLERLKKLP